MHGWLRYDHIRTVLATGEWDMCWNDNSQMAAIMGSRGIRHEMYVWGDQSYHDSPVAADGPGVSAIALAHARVVRLSRVRLALPHHGTKDDQLRFAFAAAGQQYQVPVGVIGDGVPLDVGGNFIGGAQSSLRVYREQRAFTGGVEHVRLGIEPQPSLLAGARHDRSPYRYRR